MQTALTIIGILLLLMGLVFMGQGSGYFPYPASSFMISQSRWIYYGGAIVIVGLILIVVARR
ncbi:MAG TPA: hypothetical protein VN362_21060 [Xanthobacteraceae bacterium]|jgi:hypothetical protein|nr:hypothetical protein [Xanthobacteraceae bacterium]